MRVCLFLVIVVLFSCGRLTMNGLEMELAEELSADYVRIIVIDSTSMAEDWTARSRQLIVEIKNSDSIITDGKTELVSGKLKEVVDELFLRYNPEYAEFKNLKFEIVDKNAVFGRDVTVKLHFRAESAKE